MTQYRYTFYKLPYSQSGINRPIMLSATYSCLKKYIVAEFVSESVFSETQSSFCVKNWDQYQADGIDLANYVRIARLSDKGTPLSDINPSYNWITNVEICAYQYEGGQPAIVSIVGDSWVTDFCEVLRGHIVGRLEQTSNPVLIGKNRPVSLPVSASSWGGVSLPSKRAFLNDTDAYRIVAIVTTEFNNIRGLMTSVIQKYSQTDPTADDNLLGNLWDFAGMTGIKPTSGGDVPYNATLSKLYVIPEWMCNRVEYDEDEYTIVPNGVGGDIRVRPFLVRNYTLPDMLGATDTPDIAKEAADVAKKVYLRTPSRFIEIPHDTAPSDGATNPNVRVFMSYSSSGYNGKSGAQGDDELSIYAIINGDFYDLSADFETPFAVNDEALKLSQNKTSAAIKAVANVIGAVGGVVGGVASGNYFGAVLAGAGGVAGLSENYDIQRQPATAKGSGSVLSMLMCEHCTLQFVEVPATNMNEINAAVEEFGYILKVPQTVDMCDYLPEMAGHFYRMSNVSVYGFSGGSVAAEEIKAIFERGVRVVAETEEEPE